MKKTVILILVLLPIVLVITIAFAGKILSYYHHIPVEKVEFVDDVGDSLDNEYLLKVNVGETKAAAVRIFPEMATNQMISFASQDESICTVDAKGNITGVAIGNTTVLVTTSEGNKTDMINVLVVSEKVTGIRLPESEITVLLGQPLTLAPEVEPYTARNKNITFTSDNPDIVTVKPTGAVTTKGLGTATVTVTTEDGGFTATCKIHVVEGPLPLEFNMPGVENRNGVYIVKDYAFDLAPYLTHDATKIPDPAAICWTLLAGSDYAVLTDSTLSFAMARKVITVRIYVPDTPYYTDVRFFLEP